MLALSDVRYLPTNLRELFSAGTIGYRREGQMRALPQQSESWDVEGVYRAAGD